MPPSVPPEELMAFQLEDEAERYGGHGGGGDAAGGVDGDGD